MFTCVIGLDLFSITSYSITKFHLNLLIILSYSCLALFKQYSEVIPGGETSTALSQAARSNDIYLVGGSIPEICEGKVYNTCTVWDPNGNMIAKHRKVMLKVLFFLKVTSKKCS